MSSKRWWSGVFTYVKDQELLLHGHQIKDHGFAEPHLDFKSALERRNFFCHVGLRGFIAWEEDDASLRFYDCSRSLHDHKRNITHHYKFIVTDDPPHHSEYSQ